MKFILHSLLLLQMDVVFANPYLMAPQVITQQDLEQAALQDDYLDFTWKFNGMAFNCVCHNGESGFALTALTLPTECNEQFECVTQDGVTMFAYTQGLVRNALKVPVESQHSTSDYYAAKPRKLTDSPQPTSITVDQLAEYAKHQAVIFYTGAGLSIASGVPAMARLEAALHIERNNNELNVKNIVVHAPEILANIKKFCDQAKNAQPSLGHKAIARLAQKKKCAVFTENVDMLHQKSGINPLMVSAALKNDAKYFKEIDAVICVGLSHDDRGLLALYKESNPAGTIIALDLQQPDYLGQEDLLVTGDLQEVLPALAQKLDNA